MFKELNEQLEKLLESDKYGMVTSPIANKYGGSWYIKSGNKIGNYTVVDSHGRDLIISGQAYQFLKEVSELGGYGKVTSIMEGDHKGEVTNVRSHKSGNKIDLGLRDCMDNVAEIVKRAIPILLHRACVEVSIEAISESLYKKVLSSLLQNKEISDRINRAELKISYWGFKYSNAPHLDILIDPEHLYSIPKAKN